MLCGACVHNITFKEVESDNHLFTMMVPSYMKAADDMFPGIAAMQYENDSVPLYMLVFDTARFGLNETSLKTFYDSAVSHPSLVNAKLQPPKFKLINGDSAYTTRMTGVLNGNTVFYRITVIATRTHFFDILIWSKIDKEAELNDVIDKMLNSFSDINHKKV